MFLKFERLTLVEGIREKNKMGVELPRMAVEGLHVMFCLCKQKTCRHLHGENNAGCM